MPIDIFEKSTITLTGEVHSGHKKATEATFRILRNGLQLTTASAPLKDQRAETTWECPELGDDDDPYVLSFKMEIEGQEYNVTTTYKVWPRWVKATALRVADDKPFQYFKFKAQQGSSKDAITDTKGECVVYLSEPAPVTFEAIAPGEIKTWVKDRGRKRTFKAERKYKAEFVAPKKSAKPYTQLVNLSTGDKGRDQKGSLVVVKVGAEGDTKRKAKQRLGHHGDVIYLKATFGRESKRNSPLPGISDAKNIQRSPDGKTVTAEVKLGALGEPAPFKLELGLAGGDTCKLEIGTTPACADQKMEFTNLRELFYQLTYPSGLTEPSLAHMTAGLDGAKIKYSKYKALTYAEGDTPAAPLGSWFDGPMVSANLTGRCVNIGDHNKGFFHAKFVDTHNPVGVHVLVCHVQFDGGVGNAQLAHVSVKVERSDGKVTFPPSGGSQERGVAIDVSGVGGQVLEMAFQDGGKGWRNARWESLASWGPAKGSAGDIPDDHIDVNWRQRKNVVTVKLPSKAAFLVSLGIDVRVHLDVYYSKGTYNGESDGARPNLQLIRVRPPSDGGEKGMNGTMLHELGHTIKQAVQTAPPGLDIATHGRTYTGRGHQGPHCADGLDAALYNDPSKNLRGQKNCACVMYGEGADERPVAFCARCLPFVKAEDYRDITS